MIMRVPRRLAAALVVVCVWSGEGAAALSAQRTTASDLKAAFLTNFAKFTEWPPDALGPAQKLTLCVMGDASVADALERTIEGRHVAGHELAVQIVSLDGALRSCHLLYTSSLDTMRATQFLQALNGAPVLTVSDGDRFAESGGVAQLIL